LAATLSAAADPNLDDEREPLGVSARIGGLGLFNLKAAVLDTQVPLNPATGYFDDGYVVAGSSGTGAGLTWNWGYESAAQVAGNQLALHRLDNSPRPGNFDLDGSNPLFGGELVLGFEGFRFDWGKREARFGVEIGYGYLPYSSSGSSRVTRTATYTTTLHDVAGIIVPDAPYAGSFEGPGAVIPLAPIGSSVETGTGTGAVDSSFDVDFHALRLGLWIEYPVTTKLSVTASFGYAALFADGELTLTESLTFASPTMPSVATATTINSKTDWLQGVYLEVRGNWKLTESIAVFVGGLIRYQTDFTIPAAGRQGELEFGFGLGATAGIQFEF
jgi:hypothetical protein